MTTLKEKIIYLRKKEYTYNQIIEELGCSKSTISYHCKELDNSITDKNVKIKNKKQEKDRSFLIENIDIDLIILYRKDKKSYSEIKEKTGYSINIISKVCREFNLFKYRRFSNIDKSIIEQINILYSEVRSTRKVSKELNISRDSVSKYLNNDNRLLSKENRGRTISASQAVVDWRRRTKVKLVEYKGGECIRCGYKKSLGALELHHLDPNEKDFTIGGKSWSFERLKKEADKCILVCSNCHIEIHEEIRNSGV